MSVTISRKLSNSFEGALAGGGDPASSPLYVFGPFLKLIVVAGVAEVTFGASVWMAVFSVIMVSAMYRQVMSWVTDGSGGSGLAEEEFGSWAVKINAGITVIEYVLTFLVSMAALVTFTADRFAVLNDSFAGFQYRVYLAVIFTLITCWLVNLGPKATARAFGPATGAILLLLWIMVITTIVKEGFHLPALNLQAFSLDTTDFVNANGEQESSSYLNLTLGGYARILALMTGVEIFANLVAAYGGTRAERSRKAFGSLIIIMGTTVITMLVVGPAILKHADPMNGHVSVFTQTMDFLLPPWLSYAGTLAGIAVLLSAAASAAQGVQNLSLGLRYRHYIAARLGERNRHDVAGLPVWMMGGLCTVCYLLFGTSEETYLALYAAGVFILLSMTGWAACKRLSREVRQEGSKRLPLLLGTATAALLTTMATAIIFEERFFDGAWTYFIMVPMCYAVFSYYRRRLGAPTSVEDRLGLTLSGQGFVPQLMVGQSEEEAFFRKILIACEGDIRFERVFPLAKALARRENPAPEQQEMAIELLWVNNESMSRADQLDYLNSVAGMLRKSGFPTQYKIAQGDEASLINRRAVTTQADLIVMPVQSGSAVEKLRYGNMARDVVKKTLIPTLVAPLQENGNPPDFTGPILVALDGSAAAESVLPYIRSMVHCLGGKVLLLSVPEGSESEEYTKTIGAYAEGIAAQLQKEGIEASASVTGSGPARTILALAEELQTRLIMMASHGRGGLREKIHLGSVSEKVLQDASCQVLIVPLSRGK